ncbi:FecR family protein [Algibacter pacificus]|uniref:FecR family protein n=1 Tax=Algibacter pacificus TaxID=2599389 RepID=UPI0011C942D1|nr:FecR family protein [Algibacter pacificus]
MNDDIFYEIAFKNLANETSVEDKELLERYLQHSEYKNKYNELVEILSHETSSKIFNEFNLKHGLKTLRRKINQEEKRKFSINKKAFAIAASLLLFLGIGTLLNNANFSNPSVNYVLVTSLEGQRTQIILPDSSIVFLNTGSEIRYPEKFNNKQRSVFLKGEAFFKVKRDVYKPFVVNSGNFKTTVLGTSFNVNSTAQTNFSVVVKTGKVKVENTNTKKEFILIKNTQVVFNKELNALEKSAVNAAYVTDWHNNILRFDAITLKEAFSKIEAWYHVKVQCESEAILNKKIRAVYNNEPIDKVFKSLEFMVGLKYKIENNKVIIK